MGRASLIIISGFIVAFGFMNYSLTKTGTSVVDNYATAFERMGAVNASNSALQEILYKVANKIIVPTATPTNYPVTVNLDGNPLTANVSVAKINTVGSDTDRFYVETLWGKMHTNGTEAEHQDTLKSWVIAAPIKMELPTITSSVRTFDSVATFDFAGSPTKVHGQDTDTNGVVVAGGTTLPAFTVTNVADSVTLRAAISKPGIITGLGDPPIQVAKPGQEVDIDKVVSELSSMANQTITVTSVTGSTADLGTVTNPKITVFSPPRTSPTVNPEVRISGNVTGAGVLIVNADLWVSGTINFKGLVLVIGSRTITFEATGTPQIFGALMVSGKLLDFVSKGNGDIYYSKQALELVKNGLSSGRMSTIAWWEN